MIPASKPVFDEEMKKAAIDALTNERFVFGESVFKFEEEFAAYMGTKHAISINNGTDALKIALLSIGIKHGDEVVTSASSYIATSNAVIHAGGTPKFADIGGDRNIEPSKISPLINSKTKALLPVHLYGLPAKMDEINEIAQSKGLKVIEDACQAHGSTYKGKKAGTLSTAGCYSFYTSKNMMVGGDGGMIVTDDDAVAKMAVKLRNGGRESQYVHNEIGFTNRLNTVNAAIGRVQLRRLDGWNESRRKAAEVYGQKLAGVAQIELPPKVSYAVGNYHLYATKAERRNELMAFLDKKGVQTLTNYIHPIPLQPAYKKLYGYKEGQFPVSEELSNKVLCLPMFAEIKPEEIGVVCDAVKEFYSKM